MDTTELLKLALTCSVVKPQKIAKHFSPGKTITGPEDIIVIAQEEWQAKRILGLILASCTAKYGISKKKGHPLGCPHLNIWNDLVLGIADLNQYAEIFTFLSPCPVKKKKNKNAKTKSTSSSSYVSKMERQALVKKEKRQVEHNREMERYIWKRENRHRLAQIRLTLTPSKMRIIYLTVKKEKKVTIERLCIKSNTSKYAIEGIENGTVVDTYTTARLVYFMLTNNDIDRSVYADEPIEVFVDYLAGLEFRIRNFVPAQNRVIDNPKACNLPLYLKR